MLKYSLASKRGILFSGAPATPPQLACLFIKLRLRQPIHPMSLIETLLSKLLALDAFCTLAYVTLLPAVLISVALVLTVVTDDPLLLKHLSVPLTYTVLEFSVAQGALIAW